MTKHRDKRQKYDSVQLPPRITDDETIELDPQDDEIASKYETIRTYDGFSATCAWKAYKLITLLPVGLDLQDISVLRNRTKVICNAFQTMPISDTKSKWLITELMKRVPSLQEGSMQFSRVEKEYRLDFQLALFTLLSSKNVPTKLGQKLANMAVDVVLPRDDKFSTDVANAALKIWDAYDIRDCINKIIPYLLQLLKRGPPETIVNDSVLLLVKITNCLSRVDVRMKRLLLKDFLPISMKLCGMMTLTWIIYIWRRLIPNASECCANELLYLLKEVQTLMYKEDYSTPVALHVLLILGSMMDCEGTHIDKNVAKQLGPVVLAMWDDGGWYRKLESQFVYRDSHTEQMFSCVLELFEHKYFKFAKKFHLDPDLYTDSDDE